MVVSAPLLLRLVSGRGTRATAHHVWFVVSRHRRL